MRVLITGSEGYIGKVLSNMLIDRGHVVVGLDTKYYEDLERDYFLIEKDIRNVISSDLRDIDAVIHLAALSNDSMGMIDKNVTIEINATASLNLANLCRKNGIQRFLFSSSCSVYGMTDGFVDERSELDPITEYAKSKIQSETLISNLATRKFSPVFLRNATAYGYSPSMRTDLVVNNFVANAMVNKKIKIMSDGTPWRPIVHVKDISSAFISCLEEPIENVHNEIFNVGITGENYRVSEIAQEVSKQIPSDIEILGSGDKDRRDYRVNFDKLNKQLKTFNPKWNLRKGITEMKKKLNITTLDLSEDKFVRLSALKKIIEEKKVNNELYKVIK